MTDNLNERDHFLILEKTIDDKSYECLCFFQKISNQMDWYYCTEIPMKSIEETTIDYFVIFLIIFFMLGLLIFNGAIILVLNKKLKKSLSEEKRALRYAEAASSAKSNFLSRMSHEIRTPLNAIIGYLDIARDSANDHEKFLDCLDKTDIASKHLLSVINDILDVSAIETGKIDIVEEPFILDTIVNSLSSMFYTLSTKKGINFELYLDDVFNKSLMGDSVRLNQILINLLNNAVKFTPKGGSIALRINKVLDEGDDLIIRFSVTDTGIGMSKDYLTHIFEPFEQEDNTIIRKYGGSGLGLAITKLLVDLMKGTILIDSKVGAGSTFYVTIPFRCSSEKKEKDYSKQRVIIINDDIDSKKYNELLFNSIRIQKEIVFDAKEFLLKLKENDNYDLVIVNMMLPIDNSLEVIKSINKLSLKHKPHIVLSTYDYLSLKIDNTIGIESVIQKPLTITSVYQLLDSLFDNKETKPLGTNVLSDDTLQGLRVLLVEDNDMNMEIASYILCNAKAKVIEAKNGEEAVKAFSSSEVGYYDVILMDIQMPVMDGYSATKIIRSLNRSDALTVPIIAMTANAFVSDITKSLSVGMTTHISKPIDVSELIKTIKKNTNKASL